MPDPPPPSAKDEQHGKAVLNQLTNQYQLDTDDDNILRVRKIIDRLARYATSQRAIWHSFVLKDDEFKNAAATYGNYIFIWTGMIKAAENDHELATVLAHEMGHVLAGHPRPSPQEEARVIASGVAAQVARQIMFAQGGIVGLLAGLGEFAARMLLQAILLNPEQQRKEFEADHIGLFLMAEAGFNPKAAIDFWERVQSDPDFSGTSIAFLSSHPSSEERFEELKSHLPKATERFEQLFGKKK